MNDNSYKSIGDASDKSLSEMIGNFIKHHRVNQNFSQDEVANRAGISRSTLSLLERGGKVNITTLLQVLRVLDQLHVLEAFKVEEQISPLEYAKLKKNTRQKASPRKSGNQNQEEDLGW